MLDAFELLRRDVPEAELLVAGPDFGAMPVRAGVAYVGDASREQLAGLFGRADAFVMPSRFEAYGLVFLEAMSFGLPVVARDAFEMARFVDDGANGVLVGSDDPAELAQAMQRALSDAEMHRECERRAAECGSEWTWEAVAERIYNVIEEDCGRAGS